MGETQVSEAGRHAGRTLQTEITNSVHIGERGWHLLDFARAFTGPGLLDLASCHGILWLDTPDPARTLGLIESYVATGGPGQALAMRGGPDAASWALSWHRVWVLALELPRSA